MVAEGEPGFFSEIRSAKAVPKIPATATMKMINLFMLQMIIRRPCSP